MFIVSSHLKFRNIIISNALKWNRKTNKDYNFHVSDNKESNTKDVQNSIKDDQ